MMKLPLQIKGSRSVTSGHGQSDDVIQIADEDGAVVLEVPDFWDEKKQQEWAAFVVERLNK